MGAAVHARTQEPGPTAQAEASSLGGHPHCPSLVLAHRLSGSSLAPAPCGPSPGLSDGSGFVWSLDSSLPPTHPPRMPGRPSALFVSSRPSEGQTPPHLHPRRLSPPAPSPRGARDDSPRSVIELQMATMGPRSRTQGPFGEGSGLAAVVAGAAQPMATSLRPGPPLPASSAARMATPDPLTAMSTHTPDTRLLCCGDHGWRARAWGCGLGTSDLGLRGSSARVQGGLTASWAVKTGAREVGAKHSPPASMTSRAQSLPGRATTAPGQALLPALWCPFLLTTA